MEPKKTTSVLLVLIAFHDTVNEEFFAAANWLKHRIKFLFCDFWMLHKSGIVHFFE